MPLFSKFIPSSSNYQLIFVSLVSIILILNLAIYYHESRKVRKKTQCGFISCYQFTIMLTLVALVVDISLLTAIFQNIQLPLLVPIMIGILILIIILLEYYQTHQNIDEINNLLESNQTYNHKIRLSILLLVVIFQLFMFTSKYISEYKPSSSPTIIQSLILHRFGGFQKGNRFKFLSAWSILMGMTVSVVRIYQILSKKERAKSDIEYSEESIKNITKNITKIF